VIEKNRIRKYTAYSWFANYQITKLPNYEIVFSDHPITGSSDHPMTRFCFGMRVL